MARPGQPVHQVRPRAGPPGVPAQTGSGCSRAASRFGSRSGPIPLTLVNDLAQAVWSCCGWRPQTPRLRLSRRRSPRIAAEPKVQVEVPATAVADGPVWSRRSLHTPSGAPVRPAGAAAHPGDAVSARSALVITVGAAVVLFLAAAVLIARRVRRARPGGRGLRPPHRPPTATAREGRRESVAADRDAISSTDGDADGGGALAVRAASMAAGRWSPARSVSSATLSSPRRIGTTCSPTTYNVANTSRTSIYILLAGGVLNAVFVPQLVRAMKDGRRRPGLHRPAADPGGPGPAGAHRVATAGRAAARSRCTRRASWDDRGRRHARPPSRSGACRRSSSTALYTMLGQVLNARGSFGPMMWAPIVNNLVAIAAGLLFIAVFTVDVRDPARSRAAGIAAARRRHHARCRRCRPWCWCRCCAGRGFRYRPRFDFRGCGLGKAGELAKWTLLFVLVNQLAYIVIVNLALRADVEATGRAPATASASRRYANAYLIFILPHSIITVSVMTGAAAPDEPAQAADGDLPAVRATLSDGLAADRGRHRARGRRRWSRSGRTSPACSTPARRARRRPLHRPASPRPSPSACRRSPRSTSRCAASTPSRTPAPRSCCRWPSPPPTSCSHWSRTPCSRCAGGWSASRWPTPLTYLVGLALSTSVLRRRTGGLDGHNVVRHYVRLLAAAVPAGLLGWLVARLVGQWLGDDLGGLGRLTGRRRAGAPARVRRRGPRPARPRADRPAGSAGHPVSPLTARPSSESLRRPTHRPCALSSCDPPAPRRPTVAGS